MAFVTYLLSVLGSAALGAVAVREHRCLRARRRGLFGDALADFAEAKISFGGDDFPRAEFTHKGRAVRVELIPDTMTIRRLPQLWLSATLIEYRAGMPGFAILVRPSGNDFFSLTGHFRCILSPVPGMPSEVLLRGTDERAQALLRSLAKPLADILSDPCVKEVAVTERGLRIIRQAAEGRRGAHLILRQAEFGETTVAAADLRNIVDALERLRLANPLQTKAQAAA